MIEISSCMNSLVIWPPHTKLYWQNQTKPYQTILIHTKPHHIASLYLQSSITAISIPNATLLSCHFRKIATVSHFRLVELLWTSSFHLNWKGKQLHWFKIVVLYFLVVHSSKDSSWHPLIFLSIDRKESVTAISFITFRLCSIPIDNSNGSVNKCEYYINKLTL